MHIFRLTINNSFVFFLMRCKLDRQCHPNAVRQGDEEEKDAKSGFKELVWGSKRER